MIREFIHNQEGENARYESMKLGVYPSMVGITAICVASSISPDRKMFYSCCDILRATNWLY
jgi:hypothetical protein